MGTARAAGAGDEDVGLQPDRLGISWANTTTPHYFADEDWCSHDSHRATPAHQGVNPGRYGGDEQGEHDTLE